MKYLLDSDTLIRAKNDFYPFDSAPGFWTWIECLNEKDVVYSIDKIKQELVDEGDQLSNWARMRGSAFFLKTDGSEVQKALKQVANWIASHERYSDAAKRVFLSAADFYLVAYAMAMGNTRCTVVTFEKDEPNSVESIKIPSVGKQFDVRCINLYRLVKESPVKLVLR